MISFSALRQCPANRRSLRLSVPEIGGRSLSLVCTVIYLVFLVCSACARLFFHFFLN